MENIIKTYPSGLRLIVRHMPNFKSVAASIHVSVGSCDELENEHGLSHLVEHMLFKGTPTRTSEQIAQTLSEQGVDYNAYTSQTATCYHTRGLATNLDICCDILSDMFFNLRFKEADFTREVEVVVQEIAMHDDNPRSALSELASETFFANTPYGHGIAGTTESVRSFKAEDIYAYIKKHYTAPKTIIGFAGDITLERAEEMLNKYFHPKFKTTALPLERILDENRKCIPARQLAKRHKDIEQQNVALLFPVMNCAHSDRYVMTFIHEIFSSDMSSRLFNSVRDKLGLVYGIRGGLTLTDIGGHYYIWFSCTPKNTKKVVETIVSEIARLKSEGVTDAEMNKVRNIKRTDRLFEAENVERTNQRNVTLLSQYNRIESVEEYLEKIDAVTPDEVLRAANQYLNYDNAVVAIVGKEIKLQPWTILKQ